MGMRRLGAVVVVGGFLFGGGCESADDHATLENELADGPREEAPTGQDPQSSTPGSAGGAPGMESFERLGSQLTGEQREQFEQAMARMRRAPQDAAGTGAGAAEPESGETGPGVAGERLAPLLETLRDAGSTKHEKVAALTRLHLHLLKEKSPAVVPVLIDLLDDPEGDVRVMAVNLLGSLGEMAAPAAAELARLIDDPALGPVVTGALLRLETAAAPAVEILTSRLESATSPQVATQILNVLSAVGEAARPALPAIDATGERFPQLAAMARNTRQRISGE